MKGLLIAGIVSLLAGTAAAMGLGGGFVLLVYLTALAGIPQMEAQWINLIFFLPIGGLALFWHGKNGLIEKKAVIPAVIFGLFGAAGGSFLARFLGDEVLTRIFSVFLGIVGVKELLQLGK